MGAVYNELHPSECDSETRALGAAAAAMSQQHTRPGSGAWSQRLGERPVRSLRDWPSVVVGYTPSSIAPLFLSSSQPISTA